MKIGFFDNGIGFRGTTRAMIEYALLFSPVNNIKFFFIKESKWNQLSICPQILKLGIELHPISNYEEIKGHNLDLLYHITGAPHSSLGWVNGLADLSIIHQCGFNRIKDVEGSITAYVSHWQNYHFSCSSKNVLPHVISKPKDQPSQNNAREALGIPQDSIVFSRHGGFDTWNLPWVTKVVYEVAKSRKDLYFLFMNTPKFCDLKNVLFLEATSSSAERDIFLAASNCMLHARWEGETFGLACAEFLIRGKPIITWSGSRERNHILLGGQSVIFYNMPEDLYTILCSLTLDKLGFFAGQIPYENLEYYFAPQVRNILSSLLQPYNIKI